MRRSGDGDTNAVRDVKQFTGTGGGSTCIDLLALYKFWNRGPVAATAEELHGGRGDNVEAATIKTGEGMAAEINEIQNLMQGNTYTIIMTRACCQVIQWCLQCIHFLKKGGEGQLVVDLSTPYCAMVWWNLEQDVHHNGKHLLIKHLFPPAKALLQRWVCAFRRLPTCYIRQEPK